MNAPVLAPVLVLLALVLAPLAAAQDRPELARWLPEDSLAYVRVADGSALAERLSAGPFGRLLALPDLAPVLEFLKAVLAEPLDELDGRSRETLGLGPLELLRLARGEFACGVLRPAGEGGRPGLVVVLDAGERGEDLRTLAEALEEGSFGEHRLEGTRLLFSTVPGMVDALSRGPAEGARSLLDRPGFVAGRRAAGDGADLLAWADLPAWLDLSGAELGGLGLDSLRAATLEARATEEGYVARLHLATEGERTGVVAWLAGGNVPAEFDPQIPDLAVDATVGRLDLPGAWRLALAATERFDPPTAERLRRGVERLESESGVAIERFLGRFGQAYSGYSVRAELGGLAFDTVFRLPADDPGETLEELVALARAGSVEVVAVEASGRTIFSLSPIERDDFGDSVLLFELLDLLGLPRAFAADGSCLLAANSPQALRRALLAGEFRSDPRFAPGEYVHRHWVDQRRVAGGYYNLALPFVRLYHPFYRDNLPLDPGFHPDRLPPAEALARHLPEAELVLRSTGDAIVLEARSLVLPGPAALVPALAAGAASLSSFRGRRVASSRPRCGANLKQIGLGISLYQQQNADRTPPFGNPAFFETIRGSTLEDPGVFRCPSGAPQDATDYGIHVEDYRTWSAGDLTTGRIAKFGSRIPIAWDASPEHHDGVRNVLFADGHVEEVEEGSFQEILAGCEEEHEFER